MGSIVGLVEHDATGSRVDRPWKGADMHEVVC